MTLLRRLLSTPKRLCDKAQDRAFERQLRQLQETMYAEQRQQFEEFQRQMDEKGHGIEAEFYRDWFYERSD